MTAAAVTAEAGIVTAVARFQLVNRTRVAPGPVQAPAPRKMQADAGRAAFLATAHSAPETAAAAGGALAEMASAVLRAAV